MPLSISTVNVNGIRAAVKHRSETNRGFLPWLEDSSLDVVLLQEVRASEDLARDALAPALQAGWHLTMSESAVKGHAGVGVLTRRAPEAVRIGFGSAEFDELGRYLEVDLDTDLGPVTAASLYLPKGAALTDAEKDIAKFEEKARFLDEFGDHLGRLVRRRRHVVVGGDWNIAHAEADIKNWKGNLKSPGFLPHERAWVGGLLEAGWRDVSRELHPGESGPYSWWSWRGKAFDNDSGWRIDYQLTNRSLAERAVKTTVDRAAAYDLRWSDHAPVTVVYE
ncbi:exodeoxyribonuclease III [Gordonia amicalis]|uniref:Exodeoxyribonuclease III n=1 Tax=Gordonia amicalis TaxID=89053 RepID=A0AAE4U089_9ACTN|nr:MULTISPECIES: exodeoxyribonuclease III [Gordonia]MCZ4578079.1 exodeoxyribonuclease III [Gordonia amicalis]MDV6306682.1 exodeoxyribonuclease III [Gordonia amicalis]MDV6310879.1 exodeoxyribonuclease III [Gordonia amicalis]UPW13919.1 exodeoxyribonuclease III [Gordonia amicalis]